MSGDKGEAVEYRHLRCDEVARHVRRLTIDRPGKRNALGMTTVSELVHALQQAQAADDVRVVLLTGGGSVFCAGGDLSQMGSPSGADRALVPEASFADLQALLSSLCKPTIAMVNGHAVGGGLGLVVACDLAVAVDGAMFATPEINVGLWPMVIMASILRNIGRKDAMRLILTGEKINATEAARIGLINEVVSADQLESRALELADSLAAKSPTAMRLGLEARRAMEELSFAAALPMLQDRLGTLLATEDAREGMSAFVQKRRPVFSGR